MKEPLKEPQKREIPASRKAAHWAISAIFLYIVGAYFLFESFAPPALGAFFLILAFVFTGIAAQIHYRD
jgi:hypothetical protein